MIHLIIIFVNNQILQISTMEILISRGLTSDSNILKFHILRFTPQSIRLEINDTFEQHDHTIR